MKLNQIKLIVITFFLVLSISAKAQFSAGVTGGLNLSKISGGNVSDSKSGTGINLGIWAKYDLAGNFGSQMGLLFSSIKSKDLELDDMPLTDEWKVSYLQVPVYVTYTFPIQDNFKLNILGGAYAGLKIGSKFEGSFEGNLTNFLDFGFSGGVDFEITPEVSIQSTYSLGILNTISNQEFEIGKGYNRFWQFRVVYYFSKM